MPGHVIRIQTHDFDASVEKQRLQCISPTVGAVVEFTGCVRADAVASGEPVEAIFLEHYPGMAERAIARIIEEACSRWPLIAVTVIHRVGRLEVGEDIVYVGAAAAHRQAALDCVGFIMDFLKNDVPIWKKVITGSQQSWVDRKVSDVEAQKAWLCSDDS